MFIFFVNPGSFSSFLCDWQAGCELSQMYCMLASCEMSFDFGVVRHGPRTVNYFGSKTDCVSDFGISSGFLLFL